MRRFLPRYAVGLFAAVFGFTPSLLAASLQSRAEKSNKELKTGAPGEKGSS